MWIQANPNPRKKRVGDCVIRAISIATGRPWRDVYRDLFAVGFRESDVMTSNYVWGKYLYQLGFEPFILPDACPECVTVRAFADIYPDGIYIVGTGNHAVAVVYGNYFDTWDSGGEVPNYFFKVR